MALFQNATEGNILVCTLTHLPAVMCQCHHRQGHCLSINSSNELRCSHCQWQIRMPSLTTVMSVEWCLTLTILPIHCLREEAALSHCFQSGIITPCSSFVLSKVTEPLMPMVRTVNFSPYFWWLWVFFCAWCFLFIFYTVRYWYSCLCFMSVGNFTLLAMQRLPNEI